MQLSGSQIRAIRASWARAAAAPDMAARLFYGRLFRLAPEARALFGPDIESQGRKLLDTLSFVVAHLDDAEPLRHEAAALARRHVGYGVTADQYDTVGDSLLWMLEHILGPAFDETTREAWTAAYDGLSGMMIAAADGEGERVQYA
jgi:nitric oxide dioxygenase